MLQLQVAKLTAYRRDLITLRILQRFPESIFADVVVKDNVMTFSLWEEVQQIFLCWED